MNGLLPSRLMRIACRLVAAVVRRMAIFDFDDTLVSSQSSVSVTHANGENTVLDSAEFAYFKGTEGDSLDFSDFNNVSKPRIIKKGMDALKKAAADPDTRTVILTARPKGAASSVKKFLESLGLKNVEAVALQSSDPMDKAKWIEQQSGDIEEVSFMDDSSRNTDAVGTLSGKIKSKVTTLHVPHPSDGDYEGGVIDQVFKSDTPTFEKVQIKEKVEQPKPQSQTQQQSQPEVKDLHLKSEWWNNQTPEFHRQYCQNHPSSGYCKVASIVDRITRNFTGLDFPSVDALNDYMREHPKGDRTNHRVVKMSPKVTRRDQDRGKSKGKVQVNKRLVSQAVYRKDVGWLTKDGQPVPPHVKSRSIPPAWKKVRFDPNPKAELVVQGRDAQGQLQSKYSDSHNIKSAATKFARIGELLKKKNAIQKENETKLGDGNVGEEAACLKLIMVTGIRPGSTKDTKAKKQAYGATTLEGRHVIIKDNKVHLEFTGKKGVALNIPVSDKDVADDLVKRAKKAGPKGKLFNTSHASLLKHTHTLDGGMFKTKDMRTMVGTSLAIETIKKMDVPTTAQEYKTRVKEVATVVSTKLGNTPIVALQSYINPVVFTPWRNIEWSASLGGGK